MTETLLEVHETLTPADHQTHRRYVFEVPLGCRELHLRVRYAPKHLTKQESAPLVDAALLEQTADLARRLGEPRSRQWREGLGQRANPVRIANLLTPSLDDAAGTYRGAGHRQSNDQHLTLGPSAASPGLVAGPLLPGAWTLTISAHTLVSAQCELAIEIDAEMTSSR